MSTRHHTHTSGAYSASLRWVVFLLLATLPGLTARAAPAPRAARAISASPANLVTVTTAADIADGVTSSFTNLNGNHGPDGAISLREAMLAANATPTSVLTLTIAFNIPTTDPRYDPAGGTWTIPVGSPFGSANGTALPPLARGNLQIDGSTQPGATAHPRIVLDGYDVTDAGGAGLTITSSGNLVRGLAVANFPDAGILISGAAAAYNRILGCYVGTDARGLSGQPNITGVKIQAGAHDTLIGGSSAPARNLISGNTAYIAGVWIDGSTTANNIVAGNWIGVDSSGQAALANAWAGVYVSNGAHDNLIGGAGQGNLISGNVKGVYLDSGSANTTVAGNMIGLAADGKTPIANTDGGLFIAHGAHDNLIGGTAPGARNVISGNGVSASPYGQGINIQGLNTTNNTIQGNYIGVDASGNFPAGNIHQGVLITVDAQSNTVGGTAVGAGNVIAYNGLGGVRLDSAANQVAGNLIGVGADGVTALPNQQNGVRVFGDTNVIGPDNLIAHNQLSGIMLSGSNTTIISNTLDDNARSGICVAGAGARIRGNWITGNGGVDGPAPDCNIQGGVVITGTGDTEVINNTILNNQGAGITVRTGVDNRLLSNSVSGNSTVGILLLNGGNGEIAPPALERASPSAVVGRSCPSCHVEIFTDRDDEGRNFIIAATAQPDGSFLIPLSPNALQPPHVTATNTDLNGNTSPFAAPVDVTPDPPPPSFYVYIPMVAR